MRLRRSRRRCRTRASNILLDIVATSGTLRILELPYVFRARQHGASKLDAQIALDFLALLVAKLTGDAVSFRFLMFCFVGLTGIAIHMAALQLAVEALDLPFRAAQAVAVVTAITWNFALDQSVDLPRPAADRLAFPDRSAALSTDLFGRRHFEHRRGQLDL